MSYTVTVYLRDPIEGVGAERTFKRVHGAVVADGRTARFNQVHQAGTLLIQQDAHTLRAAFVHGAWSSFEQQEDAEAVRPATAILPPSGYAEGTQRPLSGAVADQARQQAGNDSPDDVHNTTWGARALAKFDRLSVQDPKERPTFYAGSKLREFLDNETRQKDVDVLTALRHVIGEGLADYSSNETARFTETDRLLTGFLRSLNKTVG